MKKVLVVLLSVLLLLCCGCGESVNNAESSTKEQPKASDITMDDINGLWEYKNPKSGNYSASVYIDAPNVYLKFWFEKNGAPSVAEVKQEKYLIANDLKFERYDASYDRVVTSEHQCWDDESIAYSVTRYYKYIFGYLYMDVSSGGANDPHSQMTFEKK